MATATATRRKLVLKMSVSLDGFVAGPNDEVDWIFRTLGDDSMEWVTNTHREAGAHAMGTRTYYDMAAFWPFSNSPLAQAMNDIPKVIFSRPLSNTTGLSRLIRSSLSRRALSVKSLAAGCSVTLEACAGDATPTVFFSVP